MEIEIDDEVVEEQLEKLINTTSDLRMLKVLLAEMLEKKGKFNKALLRYQFSDKELSKLFRQLYCELARL